MSLLDKNKDFYKKFPRGFEQVARNRRR